MRQTDARGQTICLYYDALARLRGKTFRDDSNVTPAIPDCLPNPTYAVNYSYDEHHGTDPEGDGGTDRSRGQLTSVSNSAYSKAFYYNDLGLLRSEVITISGSISYTTGYEYDSYRRPSLTHYPDGETTTVYYNSMGLPAKLNGSTIGDLIDGSTNVGAFTNAVTYDLAGRLTALHTMVNNRYVTYSYFPWLGSSNNTNGRLASIKVGRGIDQSNNSNDDLNDEDLLALNYTYDSFGNVGSLTERYQLETPFLYAFSYDQQNRLTEAYDAALTVPDYSYDNAGRLTGYEGLGYSYDSTHIHAVDQVNSVDRYDYDENGNMKIRNKGLSSQQTLTWDEENRLKEISGGGLPTESYLYDADGARIKKTSNGVSTYYISPLFEVTGSDVIRYYYFNGQRVAMHNNSPATNGVYTYLHTDHLGSTVLTTDTSNNPTGDQRYYAYGKQRDLVPVATDHQFTGQKLDGTGLQYYNARYYDPTLGTFISPDSIVPDAATLIDYNRYAYSRANPLKFNDPTGHCATLEGGAPDMEGDGQCWGLAYSIYGYGATGSNGFSSDWKISADQWLQDIAPQPFATAEYLNPFASRYESEWRGKVGLTSYVPNQAPPPPDAVAEFDKRFAAMLTACARQIGGACGVSTGLNGQALIIGGRFSLDGYIDQNGNRMYYLTPAFGPQISVKPLGVSGSNSYIFAPGATVDSFKGWGGSTGGSISVVRGMAVDAVFTVTNTGPKPLGFALGSQSGWNAEVHAMVSYSFMLYDSQHK